MTEPIKVNSQQKTSITPYLGLHCGEDERYGGNAGIMGGARLEKVLEDNSTFYTDLNGSLGRNIGINGTVGAEVQFGRCGIADFNVHAGTEYRPYATKVDANIKGLGQDKDPAVSVKVQDNLHLGIYEAAASASVGMKGRHMKFTVGLEGGYQGGRSIGLDNVNAKLMTLRDKCEAALKDYYGDANVKFDLQPLQLKDQVKNGWYIGPKASVEGKIGKNMSLAGNIGVNFMDGEPLAKSSIGIKYNF